MESAEPIVVDKKSCRTYVWLSTLWLSHESRQVNLLGNSIVIADDDVGTKDWSEDARYAGLVLGYPGNICGKRCYTTQIQGLTICLKRDSKKSEPLTWKTGAMAYITWCQGLQAAHVEYGSCTQEIHVRISKANKAIKFADPISYILSNYATVILYNLVSPPWWSIIGDWYCVTPTIEPCKAPKELESWTRGFRDENFISRLGEISLLCLGIM